MVAHESHPSSISELETLSDSDWLDIPSSRASDNDSVIDFDNYSDREGIDRPSSRRSFTSLASSREGVVEGWEGLIEDSADEAPPNDCDPFVDPITSAEITPDDVHPTTTVEDDTEDERVKAALDQSMMSTLSSSRSNSLSGSMQTSVIRSTRDLRLSFPDPLTSSREQLSNTSYEDLTSSPRALPAEADDASSIGDVVDPGPSATPEVTLNLIQTKPHSDVPSAITPDFSIVLYGFSGLTKASLVNSLLEKWASASGLRLACSLTHAPGVTTQIFITHSDYDEVSPTRRYISVIDKTGFDNSCSSTESSQLACPSLAIVFLPTFSSDLTLPEHTLYLPIVLPNPLATVDVFASTDYLLDAEQQWDSCGVSSGKLTSLSEWSMPVVDHEKIEQASPERIHQALQPLLSRATKKTRVALNRQTIILAMISLVLGYVVHHSFQQPSYTPAVHISGKNGSGTPGSLPSPPSAMNQSRITVIVTPSIPAIAISSQSKLEVAVFNPPSTVASTSSATHSTVTSATSDHTQVSSIAPTECNCGCGMVSWPGKMPSTDLMGVFGFVNNCIRGTKGKGKATTIQFGQEDKSLYALSTRIAGSISEYFGHYDFHPVTKAVRKDVQELLDALDHLADVISRQTSVLWEQSRGTIALLRDEFQYRNGHAKERSKQLKEMGERLLCTVGETIKTRSDIAKERALAIRDRWARTELGERIKVAGLGDSMRARRIRRKERRQQKKDMREEKRALRAFIR
ncbi:unnamed protein product [Somion occarium]|uniref:Uncharacterized protein n=1 Tax=Somion occarium TaxID=3059160 RepID=A0ABP1E9K9_9APHY